MRASFLYAQRIYTFVNEKRAINYTHLLTNVVFFKQSKTLEIFDAKDVTTK